MYPLSSLNTPSPATLAARRTLRAEYRRDMEEIAGIAHRHGFQYTPALLKEAARGLALKANEKRGNKYMRAIITPEDWVTAVREVCKGVCGAAEDYDETVCDLQDAVAVARAKHRFHGRYNEQMGLPAPAPFEAETATEFD